LRIFPPYTLGQSVLFDSGQADLAEFRLNTVIGSGWALSLDPWTIQNVLGDVVSMGAHLVVWWVCVLVIEMGLAKKLN